YVAGGNGQAIAAARAVVRMSGAGHSAAIHSTDERTVMAYASAVETYRCVVNAPCSQGASGFDTHLAPSFTVGTGYFGRSSLGENLKPDHLVQWTRIAYNSDDSEPMGNYAGLTQRLDGPLPQAPSDGVPGLGGAASAPPRRAAETSAGGLDAATRAELRRLIAEELRNVLKDNSSWRTFDRSSSSTSCSRRRCATSPRGCGARCRAGTWRRRSSRSRPGSTSRP